MSQHRLDHATQFTEHDPWEHHSDYAPTPGYCGSPYAALSAPSTSPSNVVEHSVEPTSKSLCDWEDRKAYDGDPPMCIHYRVEWRVTVNNREVSEVSKDTEEDVVLAFWQLSLKKKKSAPLRHDILAPKAADNLQTLSSLDIPGLRDVAVKEYSEWQVSNVENDTLKSAFREVCDVMLENGLDLEQVYRDQDPHFFIEKGIKIGSARRFVEDIGKWVESLKKPYQPLKIISLNNLALGAGIKALG
ncbi:hypothetical protein N7524_004334, partial [Penicillium chrysogenum]